MVGRIKRRDLSEMNMSEDQSEKRKRRESLLVVGIMMNTVGITLMQLGCISYVLMIVGLAIILLYIVREQQARRP